MSDSEGVWISQAQAGSADAFGRLVRLHQQALRAFLRRLCGNHAEADDLAQESFALAWEKIARLDATRDFRPWLFGIGWRKYRERRRGLRRLLMRESRYANDQDNIVLPDLALSLDLKDAVEKLPPDQRAAILLCLGLEFTHAQAAEILALPLGTVKSHVTRGRDRLAALLGESP
ncbi:MAG TPA: RNA polymerase sigma factor [Rhizomicrobium sp.]|nr:RNA polymerase sigma factor [Rhizomicrobium sp.]